MQDSKIEIVVKDGDVELYTLKHNVALRIFNEMEAIYDSQDANSAVGRITINRIKGE